MYTNEIKFLVAFVFRYCRAYAILLPDSPYQRLRDEKEHPSAEIHVKIHMSAKIRGGVCGNQFATLSVCENPARLLRKCDSVVEIIYGLRNANYE